VIARNDDDLHRATSLAGIGKETIVDRLRHRRGVAIVEDVACNEQGVGLLLLNLREQPGQEMLVFWQSVVSMKHVSEVPIAGSYYLHVFSGVYCEAKLSFFHQSAKDLRGEMTGPFVKLFQKSRAGTFYHDYNYYICNKN
jgi:hypothetical protein